MRYSAPVAISVLMSVAGCGGHSSKAGPGSGGTSGGDQQLAGGGQGEAGSGGDGAGAIGGHAPSDYVPEAPVPYNDTHLEDGSFESPPGFGWDSCFTRTPGSVRLHEGGAGDRERFMELTSSASCEAPCSASHPSDSQFYVWFAEGNEPPPGAGLYLDLVNLDPAAPEGRLTAYAVDSSCATQRSLLDVSLLELSLSGDWSTRCFDIALEPTEWLGFAIQGSQFHVGLDALRFGPSCK